VNALVRLEFDYPSKGALSSLY